MNEYGIEEISLEGYQLVRGQLFANTPEPTMSIWYSSIAFNVACYSALNDSGAIQLRVHHTDRKIVIVPCPSKDRDAVNWQKAPDKQKSRKIECSKFAHQLYDLWGLNKDARYRAPGKLVTADKKVMILFDFTDPEVWEGTKLANSLAK